MARIEKLTKEQQEYLPVFREEYLSAAIGGRRTDRERLKAAITDAYAEIGKKAPMVIILQSPQQAMMAIKFMKHFASEKTGDQLWDQLGDQLGDQLRDQKIYEGNYLLGSQDLYWIAWAKFAEHIGVKFTEQQSKRLNIMKRIGFECEWWWPYEGICFVSERPTTCKFEDGLLHGEIGPAVEYADGYALYMWHGTRIPEEWIKDKSSITPKVALKWENAEQRRAAIEIAGWDNVLRELKPKTIDKDPDPQIGELIEVKHKSLGDNAERFLRVQCGTGRFFSLPVPPEMKTALEANAWTWGLKDFEYKPEVRT